MAKIVTSEYDIDLVIPQLEEMSDDDFFLFCLQNKHTKIERDENHQIIFMPPEGISGSNMGIDLATNLNNWSRVNNKGRVFGSSSGFYLPDTSMRSPDLAWISMQKWSSFSDKEKQGFPYAAPEFITEIMSPTDRLKDARIKMQKWIQNGVLLAWLIDPKKQEVYIYRADGTVTRVDGFAGKLSGEEVLPGFEFDLTILTQ